MSLYGHITLKEWLSLHCVTKDVYDLFRKALMDNDEPMAVLALAELVKRGEIDSIVHVINDAIKEDHLVVGTHFSSVFANALMQIGSRDPLLKRFGRYFTLHGVWPKNTSDLLNGTAFADCERPATLNLDKRLNGFLASFAKNGWFSVEIGITEVDHVRRNSSNYNNTVRHHFNIVVKNGFVLNVEEIPDVLSILDEAGIVEPLPNYHGEEFVLYTLDEDGNWVDAEVANKKEDFFYVTHYSLK